MQINPDSYHKIELENAIRESKSKFVSKIILSIDSIHYYNTNYKVFILSKEEYECYKNNLKINWINKCQFLWDKSKYLQKKSDEQS